MKNGYEQFFKKARSAKETPARGARRFELPREPIAERKTMSKSKPVAPAPAAPLKTKKKRSFPWALSGLSFLGIALAVYGMQNAEAIEKWMKRIEIGLGVAVAQEAAAAPAAAPAPAAEKTVSEPSRSSMGEEDVEHLAKLNERKKELDAREEELARQEMELARMREELERRLKDLEGTRTRISEALADRVKTDEQKIDTLVQMYSNMKPPQAAKVFESMDEDLAVEILGRMKKKNAADIMNLLKPDKTQVFSEKYAGYKRK